MKGIEMDDDKKGRRSSIFVKLLLLVGFLYFAFHIANALADDTIIIPQSDGTQKVCIIDRGYVVVCI